MRWWLLALVLGGCQLVFDVKASPAQDADEDGDGVPNDIDNCPGQFNDDQSSDDGDGVGTACDPDPANPGDQILATELFDTGFGGASPSGTGFELVGGAAQTLGEDVEQIDAVLELVAAENGRTGLFAEVGFTILDFGGLGNSFSVEMQSAMSSTVSCSFREDPLVGGTPAGLLHDNGNTTEGLRPVPDVMVGVRERLVLHARDDGGVRCDLNGSTATGTGSAEGNASVIIRSQQMRARIEYVVLYDTTRP